MINANSSQVKARLKIEYQNTTEKHNNCIEYSICIQRLQFCQGSSNRFNMRCWRAGSPLKDNVRHEKQQRAIIATNFGIL